MFTVHYLSLTVRHSHRFLLIALIKAKANPIIRPTPDNYIHQIKVFIVVIKFSKIFALIIFTGFIFGSGTALSKSDTGPSAAEIFGNPNYPAMSYGGYRGISRDEQPSVEDLVEDMKILSAMGVKLLRTYNTSQYLMAERLLMAIHQIKQQDPDFEMYVMLGAWVEAKGSWTTNVDHTKENIKNNTAEINKAVELANEYPDIVKAIAVGNEAMVQWATSYFVFPKTILKWVNHLQQLKKKKRLPKGIWITSSDNYESWGGKGKQYHTKDLEKLVKAVDFISAHTYPFHDSYYNQDYWGVLPHEEQLSRPEMMAGTMKRAMEYAQSQYQGVVDYVDSLGVKKPIHIGETGWASFDNISYGNSGSKAADEYKGRLYYDFMREWTDSAGISLFYFEGFDEQWKHASNPGGSENHFGLVRLNNEVKYALWDLFDEGRFDGLTRGGKPLVKSYGGDVTALLNEVLNPPFKSTMPVRKISTVNEAAVLGKPVTANTYVIANRRMKPTEDNDMSYPSAVVKLQPWEGSVGIEMSPKGVVTILTREGAQWGWGTGFEIQGKKGENLSKFKNGHLNFSIRGDSTLSFQIGYQSGRWEDGDQVNNFVEFGPDTSRKVGSRWISYKIPMSELDSGGNLKNVGNILSVLSTTRDQGKKIYLKNIYYTQD